MTGMRFPLLVHNVMRLLVLFGWKGIRADAAQQGPRMCASGIIATEGNTRTKSVLVAEMFALLQDKDLKNLVMHRTGAKESFCQRYFPGEAMKFPTSLQQGKSNLCQWVKGLPLMFELVKDQKQYHRSCPMPVLGGVSKMERKVMENAQAAVSEPWVRFLALSSADVVRNVETCSLVFFPLRFSQSLRMRLMCGRVGACYV